MNIVTKSGTNDPHGSAFELFRDKSMNALTETEKLPATTRRARATTAATSSAAASAARSCKDKAHFFVAVERTQQDTTQAVNTQGLFPTRTASSRRRTARTCSPARSRRTSAPAQYLSVRYGRNTNSQPYGAESQQHAERLGRQRQHVQLDQPESQLRDGRIEAERVHLPVRRLPQPHPGAHRPVPDVPRTASPSATTSTRRRPRSSRSTSSATTSRGTSPAWAASVTTSRRA